MQREPGYYWVKRQQLGVVPKFETAFWNGNKWVLIYTPGIFVDKDFLEINESRILSPDEAANLGSPQNMEMCLLAYYKYFKPEVYKILTEGDGIQAINEDPIIHDCTPKDFFKKQEDEILEAAKNQEPPKLYLMMPDKGNIKPAPTISKDDVLPPPAPKVSTKPNDVVWHEAMMATIRHIEILCDGMYLYLPKIYGTEVPNPYLKSVTI